LNNDPNATADDKVAKENEVTEEAIVAEGTNRAFSEARKEDSEAYIAV